ncbi:MAG: 3'-5' exonuclease [Verrucomicrobiota bacterium]
MTDTNAPTEVAKKSITKAQINDLPLIAWEGRVEVLCTEESMVRVANLLQEEELLGFDTETRPTFKKGEYYPPALVQLATADCVYLFRISKIGTLAPIVPILKNPKILKGGVGVKDDVKELRAMEDFDPSGFIDIVPLTTKLGYTNRGLRALAGLLLKGRISKAAQVSNWARDELDEKQIRYAATDAWISRELYLKATQENLSSDHKS